MALSLSARFLWVMLVIGRLGLLVESGHTLSMAGTQTPLIRRKCRTASIDIPSR
jgi:hypothetical protein